MALESMMLYSCPVCGYIMAGLEWEHHTGDGDKEYCCSGCGAGLNEDELYGEDIDDEKMSDVPKKSD